MKTVLAALDASLAGRPVLAAAGAFARLLDASVEAVHVRADGERTVRSIAEAAEVPVRVVSGAVVESLVEAGRRDDVTLLVIGARGLPGRGRPLGTTATGVATSVAKPVVIVPPDAAPSETLRRALVPLEGTLSSSLAPRPLVELARASQLEVVALHVLGDDAIPAFTDQAQHEHVAWAREFLRRYCPWGIGTVRLETRVGRSQELVAAVAEACDCDLIALGWSQELAPGRAPVVRATLERTHLPVMLWPVRPVGTTGADPSAAAAASLVYA